MVAFNINDLFHNWLKNWNVVLIILQFTLFKFVEQYFVMTIRNNLPLFGWEWEERNVRELQKLLFIGKQKLGVKEWSRQTSKQKSAGMRTNWMHYCYSNLQWHWIGSTFNLAFILNYTNKDSMKVDKIIFWLEVIMIFFEMVQYSYFSKLNDDIT